MSPRSAVQDEILSAVPIIFIHWEILETLTKLLKNGGEEETKTFWLDRFDFCNK